jgi:hypothetical protein
VSVHVSSAVWKTPLSPTDKLVMLALADICNDQGDAWPSNRLLTDRTGLCERAIQGSLSRLEKAGHLTRDMRSGRSTVYRLKAGTPAADAPPQQMRPAADAPHPRTTCTPPPQQMHPTPAADAPITIKEPSKEPSRNQKKAAPTSVGCPSGVDAGHWRDWLASRKGKPVTQSALDGVAREASAAGLTLAEAVRVCAERSWMGFRADWYSPVQPRATPYQSAADARDAEMGRFLGNLTGGLAGTKPNRTTFDADEFDAPAVRRIA